jgi:hypothetical protein
MIFNPDNQLTEEELDKLGETNFDGFLEYLDGKSEYLKKFTKPLDTHHLKAFASLDAAEQGKSLTDDDLKHVSGLEGVMGFMGERIPVKLRETDIRRVIKDDKLEEHNETMQHRYKIGETVKIVDGPFSTFDGVILSINGDKVSLEVKIFGRATPVELILKQIEKL